MRFRFFHKSGLQGYDEYRNETTFQVIPPFSGTPSPGPTPSPKWLEEEWRFLLHDPISGKWWGAQNSDHLWSLDDDLRHCFHELTVLHQVPTVSVDDPLEKMFL